MTRSMLRPAPLALLVALALGTPAALAQTTAQVQVDIAAQPLAQALNEWARQTRITVVVSQDLVAGKQAPAVSGRLSARDALDKLLAGSGLVAHQDGNAIVIDRRPLPTGESVLKAVTVTAQAARGATSEGSGSYTAHATTLGKSEHTLREIPQSISVITRQQMEDRNVVSIEEAMSYATGIGYYSNEGQDTGTFYARGYSGLQMQYDGIANNTGGSNIQADMAIYDRLEIQRGPAGLLQGSGNPAGTVNLVRKRGQKEFAVSGSLSAGSWDNYGGDLDVTSPLNESGSVRGRAVVAMRDRDFHYDRADKRSTTGYLALDFDLGPRTTAGLALISQDSSASPYAGVVAYSNGQMPHWKRSTNLNAPWSDSSTRINEISADLTHALSDDWTAKAGVRYRESKLDFATARLQSAINATTGRATLLRYEHQGIDETYYAADVNLSGFFTAFGRRHELLIGLNSEHNEYDYSWAVATSPGSYDVNNLPYDRSLMPHATPQNGYETNQSGFYGMTRLKLLDPLTLLLGGRWSDYEGRSRSIAAGTSHAWTTNTREKGEFTPYGGLIWDFSKQLSWYASYADVFIPQSNKDWEGNTLEPRVGWQVETGFKGEFFNGALNATVAFFRIRDENRAMTDPDASHTCNGSTCSIAAGLMQNQGWEIDISGSPLPGLELTAGYTRNDTEYLKDSNAAREGVIQPSSTSSPRHAFKFWGNYQFGAGALAGWSLGGGVQAYSKTQGSGGLRQDAYSITSLQVGYQIDRHWKAMLTVNNLFDTVYFRQLNGPAAYNYYGDPRNAMLTLRASY